MHSHLKFLLPLDRAARRAWILALLRSLMLGASCFCLAAFAQEDLSEVDEQIIQYHAKNGLDDPVARLQKHLAEGKLSLKFETNRGYLPALLRALQIPISSQGLVFSRTSSQGEHCNPQTPRAVFFADDVYVGWVPGGPVIDLAAVDPRRGPIFYTLEQRPDGPKFTRPENCVQCHLGPKTLNVPGLVVRSVYTAADGKPIAQVDAFVNGHNSALEQRWGGWYVTGTHAGALHLGNAVLTNSVPPQDWVGGQPSLSMSAGANVTDLRDRFDTARYLSRHSDIVALLVLEHEVRMQNLITRANYETRLALEEKAKQNGSAVLRSSASEAQALVSNWPQERIALAGETLLEYLLFRNEAPLKGAVKGTSSFADDFQSRGPMDSKGRSLRQLDLTTRLLRYPCSFLVYSRAFDALPSEMKSFLWKRLEQILSGEDHSSTYVGMGAEDRQAVREILRDTKPEFAAWLSSNQRQEIK